MRITLEEAEAIATVIKLVDEMREVDESTSLEDNITESAMALLEILKEKLCNRQRENKTLSLKQQERKK